MILGVIQINLNLLRRQFKNGILYNYGVFLMKFKLVRNQKNIVLSV